MRQHILFESKFGRRIMLAMATGIVLAAVSVIAKMQELKFSDPSTNRTEKFSRPTFDTVTIQEAKRSQNPLSMQTGPGSINFKSVPLRNIIEWAYRPQELWEMYKSGNDLSTLNDITAQGLPNIKPQLMVRSLLDDRFKLKLHHELQLKDIYSLVISKSGPKLIPSNGGRSSVRQEKNVAVFTHATMEMLCQFLKQERSAPVKHWLSMSPRNAVTVLDTHDGARGRAISGLLDVEPAFVERGARNMQRRDSVVLRFDRF